MIRPFELDWLGGPAAAHFRRARPGIDELPWGTLDAGAFPAELVARARLSFTEGALNEYASAAAFAALLGDLLEAGAPIDLTGMAGEFVADEMLHTELNARLAMELGGATPYRVDFAALAPEVAPGTRPLHRAVERAVRLCCVGETFSVPMLVVSARAATHPLVRAALRRIAVDEPPHARLGWLILEWALPRTGDRERARLCDVALDAAWEYASYWQLATSRAHGGVTTEGFRVADVHALGWMDAERYVDASRAALARIGAGLRRAGLPAASWEDRAWRGRE